MLPCLVIEVNVKLQQPNLDRMKMWVTYLGKEPKAPEDEENT